MIILSTAILHQCTQVCEYAVLSPYVLHVTHSPSIRLFYFLWQIAKPWLDPVTANKFVLLQPNQLDKLKVSLHEAVLGPRISRSLRYHL